jgi:hypothetical protein
VCLVLVTIRVIRPYSISARNPKAYWRCGLLFDMQDALHDDGRFRP